MAPKFDFEFYFLNPFLVKDNLIHNDVGFNVLLLTLKNCSSLEVKEGFENPLRKQLLFFMSILEVRINRNFEKV